MYAVRFLCLFVWGCGVVGLVFGFVMLRGVVLWVTGLAGFVVLVFCFCLVFCGGLN